MAKKVKGKNGREVTLLNPSEMGRKYADELRNGVRQTNDGLLKTDVLGKPVPLIDTQKAYRSGFLAAQKENAKCYNAIKKKQAREAEAKRKAKRAANKK